MSTRPSGAAPAVLAPRQGVRGLVDRLIGPGATPAELRLILVAATLGALLAVARVLAGGLGWPAWRVGVAAVLAFDLAGGVAANATATTGRWYHRAGQGFRQHVGFVAAHVGHVLVVAWAFRGRDWPYLLAVTAGLLVAAAAVLAAPRYLRRPVALLASAAAIVGAPYAFAPTEGLEWFLPLLFLKLIAGHLVPEAPPAGPPGAPGGDAQP